MCSVNRVNNDISLGKKIVCGRLKKKKKREKEKIGCNRAREIILLGDCNRETYEEAPSSDFFFLKKKTKKKIMMKEKKKKNESCRIPSAVTGAP